MRLNSEITTGPHYDSRLAGRVHIAMKTCPIYYGPSFPNLVQYLLGSPPVLNFPLAQLPDFWTILKHTGRRKHRAPDRLDANSLGPALSLPSIPSSTAGTKQMEPQLPERGRPSRIPVLLDGGNYYDLRLNLLTGTGSWPMFLGSCMHNCKSNGVVVCLGPRLWRCCVVQKYSATECLTSRLRERIHACVLILLST